MAVANPVDGEESLCQLVVVRRDAMLSGKAMPLAEGAPLRLSAACAKRGADHAGASAPSLAGRVIDISSDDDDGPSVAGGLSVAATTLCGSLSVCCIVGEDSPPTPEGAQLCDVARGCGSLALGVCGSDAGGTRKDEGSPAAAVLLGDRAFARVGSAMPLLLVERDDAAEC